MGVRSLGVMVVAVAALTAAAPAGADDGDQLSLPGAIGADDLSQETARGEEQEPQKISSQASADASIDNVTIIGPSTTGGVSGLSELIGDTNAATLQISTGSGNIQQGVSAVALAGF